MNVRAFLCPNKKGFDACLPASARCIFVSKNALTHSELALVQASEYGTIYRRKHPEFDRMAAEFCQKKTETEAYIAFEPKP